MRKKNVKIPFNLQFFAEAPEGEQQETKAPEGEQQETKAPEGEQGEKEPTVQELMVEIAKLKRAQEKAASEAAEYKKKYNAKLTEKEKIDAEKAERDAEKEQKYQELLRENRINKLEKSYLALKYTPEEAGKMAVAEVDDDLDAKLKIQLAVQERQKKEYEAEFIKRQPQIQAGMGDKDKEDPFLKGFNSVKNKYVQN